MARIKLSEHMTHETKKDNGVWWGILLIAVGAALLLHNFGLIRWNWYALWLLWPTLLIVWGVSALAIDERVKRILIAIMVAAALFWVMGGFADSVARGGTPEDRMIMRFPDARHYWR